MPTPLDLQPSSETWSPPRRGNYQVNLSVNGQTTTAVFSGYYEAGAGTQNITLSASAFAALDTNADDTSIAGSLGASLRARDANDA
ncbi:hypothetical protein B0H14DRAFT_3517675 [Mycena olivaceomarginata]|nr:hypothetical protein B0H14DRAFT_3517675 [Mycena olivaceomarginata]